MCPGPFADGLTPYQRDPPREPSPAPDRTAVEGSSTGRRSSAGGGRARPVIRIKSSDGSGSKGKGAGSSDGSKQAAAAPPAPVPDEKLEVVDAAGVAASVLLRDVHTALVKVVEGTAPKPGKKGLKQPGVARLGAEEIGGQKSQQAAAVPHWTQRAALCIAIAGTAATGQDAQVSRGNGVRGGSVVLLCVVAVDGSSKGCGRIMAVHAGRTSNLAEVLGSCA